MDFEQCFQENKLISGQPKDITLSQKKKQKKQSKRDL